MKKSYRNFFKELQKYENIVLTLHPDVDPDSLFSNFAFAEILENLGKEVAILLGDNVDLKDFKKFPEYASCILQKSFAEYSEPYDLLVALDIQRPERISKDYKKRNFKVMVFDHHLGNAFPNDDNHILCVDEQASSTAEMIMEFCKENNISLSKQSLRGLYLGIYSDTVGFTTEISENTFRVVSEIRKHVEVSEVIEKNNKALSTDDFLDFGLFIKHSEVLKEALIVVGNSHVSMRKITELVSRLENNIVILANNISENYFHVEIITSNYFPIAGKIAKAIAKEFGGGGGGHLHRAGAGIHASSKEEVNNRIKTVLKEIL